MKRTGNGVPSTLNRSPGCTLAARARMSTSSSPIAGVSSWRSRRRSGDPYRSWVMARIGLVLRVLCL